MANLVPIEYSRGMSVPTGRITLNTDTDPPEVILSPSDVDLLTYGGTLNLMLQHPFVRLIRTDNTLRDQLKNGAIGAISGVRQRAVKDDKIIDLVEAAAYALAELQKITQGTFNVNYTVRTTTENWLEGSQFTLRMPAKNIVYLLTTNSVNTEVTGLASDGREEMLHKCVAGLSDDDPLAILALAVRRQLNPMKPRKISF